MVSVRSEFKRLSKKFPHFPDGRINYAGAREALVLTVFVLHEGKMLLLKRSRKVATYKGKWNTVAGYFDEDKPVRKKALEELEEETGISLKDVRSVKVKSPFVTVDKKLKTKWIVNLTLVKLKRKPRIKLDFEHTECKWIRPEEISKYDVVPNLITGMKKVLLR